MSQDFYLNAAQQRAAELEMELSAAKQTFSQCAITRTYRGQGKR